MTKSSCLKSKDIDINYVASTSGPLPSMFKLFTLGQNGPAPGSHILDRLLA